MCAELDGGRYEYSLREGYRSHPDAGFELFFSLWALTGSPPPYRSYENGAAVRACPIGLAFSTLDQTLREAKASAASLRISIQPMARSCNDAVIVQADFLSIMTVSTLRTKTQTEGVYNDHTDLRFFKTPRLR